MKIFFISISKRWEGRTYREYPYGIGILATLAHNAGHEVKIFDMAVEERDCFEVLKNFQPDVIAVSFMSPSVQIAKKIIPELKKVSNCKILAGGIHSTLYPESVISYGADVIMIGEGEPHFLEVLNALELSATEFENALKQIPNLVFRESSGQIFYTEKVTEVFDLNELPIMNRDLFDLNLYAHHTILTSRCCPYSC